METHLGWVMYFLGLLVALAFAEMTSKADIEHHNELPLYNYFYEDYFP